MPRPYASGVIDAPVTQVWSALRDFAAISTFVPAIERSELTGDAGVGAVRRLTLGDGATLEERLLALDDLATTLVYEFVGPNPFGVRRYTATVRVAPVTDTGGSFVEWWAEFDAEAAAEEELTALFSAGVFGGGIAGLRDHLSTSGGQQ